MTGKNTEFQIQVLDNDFGQWYNHGVPLSVLSAALNCAKDAGRTTRVIPVGNKATRELVKEVIVREVDKNEKYRICFILSTSPKNLWEDDGLEMVEWHHYPSSSEATKMAKLLFPNAKVIYQ